MSFCRPLHRSLLAVVILLGAADLRAQSDLSLDMSAGFNGQFKRGKMTPFSVIVHRGPGSATKAELEKEEIELDLVIETLGERAKTVVRIPEITLRSETSKKLTAYLPMIGPDAAAYLQLGLRETARKQITLSQLYDDDRIVLALGANRESLGSLSSVEIPSAAQDEKEDIQTSMAGDEQLLPSQVQVCFSESEDLPSVRSGYDAVDLIILADFDETELSQAQKDAIENWVFDGGRVVILGGEGLSRFARVYQSPDSLIGKLLPGKIAGTRRIVDFSPLERFFGVNAPQGAAVVALLAPRPRAEVLFCTEPGANKMPLLAKATYGFGKVLFVGFDPTRPPFQGLDQRVLWTYVFKELGVECADQRPFHDGVQRAMMNLSVTQLPSIFLIGGFLIVYMAALGPLNYFVLKKLDKRSMLWLTMPATILLFLAAAYTMGLALRGRAIILNKVTIAKFANGRPTGTASTFVGVFSPRGRRYDLDFGPEAETVRENPTSEFLSADREHSPLFASYRLETKEGTSLSVTDLSVAKWTMRVLQVDHTVAFPDWLKTTIETQDRPSGQAAGALVLREIRNDSDKLMEECIVGDSKNIKPIGDVPANGLLKPNLLLQSGRPRTDWFADSGAPGAFFSVGKGDDPAAAMKQALWYTVFSRDSRCLSLSSLDGPYFACLIEDAPLDVEIRKREYTVRNLTLLICSLEGD